MIEFTTLQKITVWVLPVLFAITVHETAHGWVASRLGDLTAKMLGRLTLNPVRHIDPVGTILIPAVTLLVGGFVFGFAKPVPVTYANLNKPKRDMALVALAGPAANLLMALVWVVWIRLALFIFSDFGSIGLFMIATGVAGIYINLILMLLNLIPLPPLDGGRIMSGLLPGRYAVQYDKIEPYGLIILVLLLIMGVLGRILSPFINTFLVWFTDMAGISQIAGLSIMRAIGVYQ